MSGVSGEGAGASVPDRAVVPSASSPSVSPVPASIPRAVVREACDLLEERTFGNPQRSPSYNACNILEAALNSAEEHWRDLSADTSWIDGRDVVLFAYDMEVSARYCPGGPVQCGVEAVEYDGAVWSCFDDEFQIEIEEISSDPALWHHGRATHWREPTPPPASAMSAGTAETAQQAQGDSPPARAVGDAPILSPNPKD